MIMILSVLNNLDVINARNPNLHGVLPF